MEELDWELELQQFVNVQIVAMNLQKLKECLAVIINALNVKLHFVGPKNNK
jgi:hypothetical protein